MINKNYTSDIRTCERIKFDQALYILTMYEKKIRKNRQILMKKSLTQQKGVDADEQLDDITYAWKNKWKMDLTKPVLSCVTSVYPRILIDYGNQKDERLGGFYQTFGRFIRRLRMQHQDETNFKFVLNNYDKTTMIGGEGYHNGESQWQRRQHYFGDEQEKSEKQRLKMMNSAKASVNSILNVCYNMASQCIKHFEENFQYIISEDITDVDTEGLEWQVIRPLRFVREIARRALFSQTTQEGNDRQMDQEDVAFNESIEPSSQQASELFIFTHNVIKIMQRIKESEHGSTLVTIQPQIKQLTYLVHPLLACVYATFKKENLQKQKDFDWKESVPVETKKFMQNAKSSFNLSKIVLINLDGYESEFNLQLVRNFRRNLMYVSFPKEEAVMTDLQKVYSKRFFKKLMFRYTQAVFQSYPNENISQDMKHISKLEELNFNPQNYHYFTEKMYEQHSDRPSQDFNQNVYIFPIRNKALKENFPQMFEETQKEDIELYESYFVRFIMRDFVINQIREFNPSYVMISYSGRVFVEDGHFVEIIQQLTKVANYKLLLFPNLTAGFCSQDMMVVEDQEGNECDYDGGVNDQRIEGVLRGSQQGSMGEQRMEDQQGGVESQSIVMGRDNNSNPQKESLLIELFNKTARFLKVSSGTYNLTRSTEQDGLIGKFKNQFILAYSDELMSVLGKEYFSIDRIRFKNKDLVIIPKLFEENLNAIKKSFNKTVPEYYADLYRVLEHMLFQNRGKETETKQGKSIEELFQSYHVSKEHYQSQINELWEQLSKSSSIEISSYHNSHKTYMEQVEEKNEMKDLMEQIGEIKWRKNKRLFMELKQLHFIQIASEKYDEKATLYIKKHPENKEFNSISQESEQTQGLYDVVFLRKDKSQLKIFQSTKILYKSDQQSRQSNSVPLLVMNSLSDEKPSYFQNYIADLDVTEEPNKERKNIQERKFLVVPIVIKQNDKVKDMKSFTIKTDWNYYETREYMILYWPTEFDFIKATICKMLNRNYTPTISDAIYMARKQSSERQVFRRVPVIHTEGPGVVPRVGCSAYQFESRLFVFGGFYPKEKNYLNLQHDVTMMDLLEYQRSSGERVRVQNLKSVLYSEQNFNRQVAEQQTYNSYIRPRMEFQIYDKSELADWYQQSPQSKSIILFGGYGENFLRPFSMLTYYYYEIVFSYHDRSISSINKKIIYDKTVPINVKDMTKNLGVIKTNKKNPNTNVLENNKITQPGSYLTFRNSFRIQKGIDNSQDFKYKFRYMFAEDQYKSFKAEIKKVQEQRTEEFDSSNIHVQKIQGNNHLVSLQKDGKKCVVCLHLQIPHQKAKKMGCSREVKLTHESIIYLDSWHSMICAIIKHDFYTRGKSVLVEYNIKSLQNLSFNQDEIPHIALTWMKEFDYNLDMHILIMCNKNTTAILHGEKLLECDKVKEFIVKKKKNKSEAVAYEISQRGVVDGELMGHRPSYCHSVFFKQRNKIFCLQYLCSAEESSLMIEMAHEIELNSANDVYSWEVASERGMGKAARVVYYRVVMEESRVTVPVHKLVVCRYYRLQKEQGQVSQTGQKGKRPTERVIEVIYNKKSYYIELPSLGSNTKSGIEVLQLVSADRVKIDKDTDEKCTVLTKNVQQYYELL